MLVRPDTISSGLRVLARSLWRKRAQRVWIPCNSFSEWLLLLLLPAAPRFSGEHWRPLSCSSAACPAWQGPCCPAEPRAVLCPPVWGEPQPRRLASPSRQADRAGALCSGLGPCTASFHLWAQPGVPLASSVTLSAVQGLSLTAGSAWPSLPGQHCARCQPVPDCSPLLHMGRRSLRHSSVWAPAQVELALLGSTPKAPKHLSVCLILVTQTLSLPLAASRSTAVRL